MRVNKREDEIMNFSAYIERQKNIIRRRHEGETYLMHKGEVISVSESDRILSELSNMRGLNTRERTLCEEAV